LRGFFYFYTMEKLSSYLNLNSIFLFFFLIVGLIPSFGSIDKIGSQWLYLSIINVCFYLFFDFKSSGFRGLTFLKSNLFISFSFFLFFILISIFSSNNISESIISISRWLIVFITFVSLTYLLASFKDFLSLISFVFLIIVCCELSFIYITYYDIVSIASYKYDYSTFLIGVAGNKNVAASILALKIPFIFYILHKSKNLKFQFFIVLILFFSFYALFLINSRTILLSILICTFLSILYFLFFKKNKMFSWILIPLFSVFIFSINPLNDFSDKSLITNKLTLSESNIAARFEFYNLALNHFFSNPFLGVGIGNWKVDSLQYQNYKMKDYTVSYHVHNDFIELAVETGFFGLISYISIFLASFIYLFKIRDELYSLIIGSSFLIYFIDSNLNFPMSRVSNQIIFALILAILYNLQIRKNEEFS